METTFGLNAMAKCLFDKFHLSKTDCQEIPKFLCDCMIDALVRSKRVRLERVGVLTIKIIESHAARNPRTGECFVSAPRKGVRFKPSRYLCMRVNDVKVSRRRIFRQPKANKLPI
jgi:nucleoid DNA-binding protein